MAGDEITLGMGMCWEGLLLDRVVFEEVKFELRPE